MIRLKCNIIKDLLPSYIDGICSEETVEMVEEHVQNCESCHKMLTMMQEETEVNLTMLPEEVIKARRPFKRIKKKNRFQIALAISLTTIVLMIGYQVVQDVGVINQFFFPNVWANVAITNDSENWEKIQFDDNDYLELNNVFFKKYIVNHANNEHDIVLRIKDLDGNILIDNLTISPGMGIKLEGLKRFEKYSVEIKVPQGQYFINVS